MQPEPEPELDFVARITAALAGGESQRETAYAELTTLARGEVADKDGRAATCVACVAPLIEQVFGADVDAVDAGEFQHAKLVLAKLVSIDLVLGSAEWWREERYTRAWRQPGGAYCAVFGKEPSDLTRDDALTVSADAIAWVQAMSRGYDLTFDAAPIDAMGMLLTWGNESRIGNNTQSSEAFLVRLAELLVQLVSSPQGTPDYQIAGAWMALGFLSSGRLATMRVALTAIDVAVATLGRTSPADVVSWRTTPANAGVRLQQHAIIALIWAFTGLELSGVGDKAHLLREKGFIDLAMAFLKAFEVGEDVEGGSAVVVWGCLCSLVRLSETGSNR